MCNFYQHFWELIQPAELLTFLHVPVPTLHLRIVLLNCKNSSLFVDNLCVDRLQFLKIPEWPIC